ncbi:MAG: GNAT family N-acetyltransferase [Bacteroidota bacterium]
MDLVKENIDNLTSMWEIVNQKAGVHQSEPSYDYGVVDYSEWPNKIWLHEEVNEKVLNETIEKMTSSQGKLTLPYWNTLEMDAGQWLASQPLEIKSEQLAMYLKLGTPPKDDGRLKLIKVTDTAAAILWEKLFQQAFGYQISHKLIMLTHTDIDCFIAYKNEEAVGTAILHANNHKVLGIHSMGIIPAMRRMGLAEQMMLLLLAKAVDKGYEYATLQASPMGKGLYEKLGFEEQFLLTNYALKSQPNE